MNYDFRNPPAPPRALHLALSEIENAQLVRRTDERDATLIFKHALIQDTAQSTLLHGEFKRLNLLVAQAYEQLFPALAMNELAAVLAQHYDAAGENAKTLQYATRAGDLAARVYANAEAVEFYTHAIDHAQKMPDAGTALCELFIKRGRLYELRGSHDAALTNYNEMEQVAHVRNDRALELGALMARATIYSTPTMRFDPTHARRLSENALELARTLPDRAAEAKILWNMMLLSHYSARYDDAIAYGNQAIALARALDLREQLAFALNDISRVYFMQSLAEQGIAAATEAGSLWRLLDNKPMLADNLNTLATFFANAGENERALTLTDEAYQIGQQINNPWTMAHSCMTNSFVYLEIGQLSRALSMMQECTELAQQAGFQIAQLTMQLAFALTYAMLGDVPRGIAILQEKTDNQHTAQAWQTTLHSILAQLYTRQGEFERARAALQTSEYAHTQGMTNPFIGNAGTIAEAELALAERDNERALALINTQLQSMQLGRMRWFYGDAVLLHARILVALRRLPEAQAVLEPARAYAVRAGSRRLHWQILGLYGDIETQRGKFDDAAAYYAQARVLIEYMAAHVPDEYFESFLQTAPVQHILQSCI